MNGRRDSSLSGPPLRRFLAAVLAAVLAAQLGLSWYAWRLADDLVVPALERKAGNVGLALARNLTRALATGMPWEKLNGVDAWFDAALAANPDLAYVVLTDDAGHVLVRAGRGGEVIAPEQYVATTREVERRYVTYGQVLVGVDRRFITDRIQTIRNDTGALLLAGLVLAGQLAWFAGTLGFAAPLRQAAELLARLAAGDFRYRIGSAGQRKLALAANQLQARLNTAFAEVARLAADQRRWARAQPVLKHLRSHYRFADPGGPRDLELDRAAAARLLVCAALLADALTQAVLPAYAHGLAGPVPEWLQAALPVAATLTGLALAMPLARDWTSMFGRRPVYLCGALVAASGLATAGYVADYAVLVLARATTGLGYALLLTGALTGAEPERERRSARRATALAGGALAVAQLCGPPLGGVLADTAGARAVFVAAAWLLVGAAGLGLWLLDERLPEPWRMRGRLLPAPPRRAERAERNWQLLHVAAGAALRFQFGAFVLTAAPLWLAASRHSVASIGRYHMAIAALALLALPLLRRLAWRSNTYLWLQVLSAALCVAALALLRDAAGAWAPGAGLVLFGAAMALGLAVQQAALGRARRLFELRGGLPPLPTPLNAVEPLALALGPLASALLIHLFGPGDALRQLAALYLAWLAVFGIGQQWLARRMA